MGGSRHLSVLCPDYFEATSKQRIIHINLLGLGSQFLNADITFQSSNRAMLTRGLPELCRKRFPLWCIEDDCGQGAHAAWCL